MSQPQEGPVGGNCWPLARFFDDDHHDHGDDEHGELAGDSQTFWPPTEVTKEGGKKLAPSAKRLVETEASGWLN